MKKNKIIFWIATSIIFLWEGLMPLGTLLFAPEYATAGTKPLGYPDYLQTTWRYRNYAPKITGNIKRVGLCRPGL